MLSELIGAGLLVIEVIDLPDAVEDDVADRVDCILTFSFLRGYALRLGRRSRRAAITPHRPTAPSPTTTVFPAPTFATTAA